MNKHMRLWIDTLRKGVFPDGTPFKKGTGALHPTKDRYCCLGVACEIYMQSVKKAKPVWDKYLNDRKHVLASDAMMPNFVAKYFGKSIPEVKLVDLNDGGGIRRHTFAQIADYLEETFGSRNKQKQK